MIQKHKSVQKRLPRGFPAFGVFIAVWLNLALQPCAMAIEIAEDHDCPRCPPAQVHEHDHGGTHHRMDDVAPCVEATPACPIIQDLNHDGRSGQVKLKDIPADAFAAAAVTAPTHPNAVLAQISLRPRFAALHAGASPPLHVLHCVYLD